MTDQFFEKPILNSPYVYPARHWELDEEGQPTNKIISRLSVSRPRKQRDGRLTRAAVRLIGWSVIVIGKRSFAGWRRRIRMCGLM
ncbi:MAG: hypothetical protein ACRC8A_01035 [Microcoleaceae cyanobacterium]